jgi:hypothetical protein
VEVVLHWHEAKAHSHPHSVSIQDFHIPSEWFDKCSLAGQKLINKTVQELYSKIAGLNPASRHNTQEINTGIFWRRNEPFKSKLVSHGFINEQALFN